MEYTISATEAMILDMLSPEQVQAYIKANPSKAEGIKQALEANAQAKAKEQALEDFLALLDTIELPDPPDGTLNIYRPFRKEARHLNKAEREEVKKANPQIADSDLENRVVDTGRKICGKWELNKAMTTSSAKTEGKARTRKLAITLNKREGNTIVPVGNFRTSKEACDNFHIETGRDSARRVLEAKGYIVDDYDGNDFTLPEK